MKILETIGRKKRKRKREKEVRVAITEKELGAPPYRALRLSIF